MLSAPAVYSIPIGSIETMSMFCASVTRSTTRAEVIWRVRLADVEDTRRAIAAANRAFTDWCRRSKAERIGLLRRLHDAVLGKSDDLEEATMLEYGAPITRARWMNPAGTFGMEIKVGRGA